MPVVPAAGYPYSGVPTVDPTTSTPNNYQNIPSTPEDFGAFGGRQLSHLGETLLASGKELAATAVLVQEQANSVKANDATSNYQDAETKILYGDPNNPTDVGFYGLKGQNAVDAAPKVRQQLLDLRKQFGAGLANDRQRILFDGETRNLQAHTLRQMGVHYVTEMNGAMAASSTAKINNATTRMDAAILRGDDAEAQTWVGQRMKSEIELLHQYGHDTPEAVQEVMQKARSDFVKGRANALANSGRPDDAITFINNNSGALYKDEGEKLLQHYRGVMFQLNATRAQQGLPQLGPGQGTGGGDDDPKGAWGPQGPVAVSEMQKRGASPEFIQAAIANGLVEGGFRTEWQQNRGGANVYGHWQLNFSGGEGNRYKQDYGDKRDTASQVEFFMKRMEEEVPNITKTRDAEAAMDAIITKFERYEGAAPGQRRGALATAQRILGDQAHALEPGAKPPAAAPTAPAATITVPPPIPEKPASKEQSGNYTTSAWGDSIAAHSIRLGGTGGIEYNTAQKEDSTAVSGANPSNVQNLLEHGPEQHVKGQDVLLSTGASNVKGAGPMNEGNQDLIKDQIKTALQRGAKTVTVVGVGNAPFLAGRNEQLAAIVGSFGDPRVVFSGALNPNNLLSDGVHVKDKKAFVRDVIKVRDAGAPS